MPSSTICIIYAILCSYLPPTAFLLPLPNLAGLLFCLHTTRVPLSVFLIAKSIPIRSDLTGVPYSEELWTSQCLWLYWACFCDFHKYSMNKHWKRLCFSKTFENHPHSLLMESPRAVQVSYGWKDRGIWKCEKVWLDYKEIYNPSYSSLSAGWIVTFPWDPTGYLWGCTQFLCWPEPCRNRRNSSMATASLLCLSLVLPYHLNCPGLLSHISHCFLQNLRPLQCPHWKGVETELGEISRSHWKSLRLLALVGEPRSMLYSEYLDQWSLGP